MIRVLCWIAVGLIFALSVLSRPDADLTADPCYPYSCQSLD